MIIAVTGGREWRDPSYVSRVLYGFHGRHTITELHEGGANGWDRLCREWAQSRGIDVITYWANWTKYGKAAGHKRNGFLLDRAKPQALLAGPGGPGTANMIMQARERNITVYEFKP